MEEDVDENIYHFKYKFEMFTNSAIEQLKTPKRVQSSSIFPHLGPGGESVVIKPEPTSPSIEYQQPTHLTGMSINVSVL